MNADIYFPPDKERIQTLEKTYARIYETRKGEGYAYKLSNQHLVEYYIGMVGREWYWLNSMQLSFSVEYYGCSPKLSFGFKIRCKTFQKLILKLPHQKYFKLHIPSESEPGTVILLFLTC